MTVTNSTETFTSPGITTYTVGTSGTYEITADGAQGGGSKISNSVGGLGAGVGAEVFLQAGATLEVVVGGEGQSFGDGGGGGGSFVIETYDGTSVVDTILAVAVAGGGGGTQHMQPPVQIAPIQRSAAQDAQSSATRDSFIVHYTGLSNIQV